MRIHATNFIACVFALSSLNTYLNTMPVAPTPTPAATPQVSVPQATAQPVAPAKPTTVALPIAQPTKPTIPTAAPPVATSVTIPVAMPATKPPTPPAASPATVTTTSQNSSQHLELDSILKQIEITRRELTQLLADLDNKLLDARKKSAEAKMLSTNLLNQGQEETAKNNFDSIKLTSNLVQTTQDFVQKEFSKKFNDKVAEFKVLTNKAENLLTIINAQTPPAATSLPTTPALATAALPSPSPQAPQATSTVKKENRSFFDSITSGVASTITWVKRLFSDDESFKKKSNNSVSTSATNNQATPSSPVAMARDATQLIQTIDSNLAALDLTRNNITQYYSSINQSMEKIETLAKKNTASLKLFEESKKIEEKKQSPFWKIITIKIISKVLDGIEYLASLAYKLFDATIGKFSRMLVKDVNAKIAAEENNSTPPHTP